MQVAKIAAGKEGVDIGSLQLRGGLEHRHSREGTRAAGGGDAGGIFSPQRRVEEGQRQRHRTRSAGGAQRPGRVLLIQEQKRAFQAHGMSAIEPAAQGESASQGGTEVDVLAAHQHRGAGLAQGAGSQY
jgi:hypothetical protein